MDCVLEVVGGNEAGRQVRLAPGDYVVGRDPAYAKVVFSDPSVSRSHARVYCRGDRWFIADLGGANGTAINGAPVAQTPVELGHGDSIRLGGAALRVSLVAQQPAHASAMPTVMPAQPATPAPARPAADLSPSILFIACVLLFLAGSPWFLATGIMPFALAGAGAGLIGWGSSFIRQGWKGDRIAVGISMLVLGLLFVLSGVLLVAGARNANPFSTGGEFG